MKRNLFLLPLLLFFASNGQEQAIISGKIAQSLRDTVKLVLNLNEITRQREIITIPLQQGQFLQAIAIATPVYITLMDGTNYINMLIQPGDSIHLEYDGGQPSSTLAFSGKGKEQCKFLHDMASLNMQDRLKKQVSIAKQTTYPFDYLFGYIDSTEQSCLKQLYNLQNIVSTGVFNLLYTQIKSYFLSYKYKSVGAIYHESIYFTVKNRKKQLTPATITAFDHLLKFDSSCANSPYYINTVYNILFMQYDAAMLEQEFPNSLPIKYAWLDSILPLSLKTPILTMFLESDMSKLNQTENLEMLISSIYHSATDSMYKNYIVKRFEEATKFYKGMNAPDFVLENEKGEKISLSAFRGKVVFIDFWYAACGPCIAGFKSLHNLKQQFANKEVVFLNISIDYRDTWLKSLKELNILGYHAFTENKGTNHPIISAYRINSYPTTCLLDSQGNIFVVNPSRNPQELEIQLKEALQTRKP